MHGARWRDAERAAFSGGRGGRVEGADGAGAVEVIMVGSLAEVYPLEVSRRHR